MAGLRHLCANTSGVGVNRPGCFAEYIVLPMTNVWKHDPKVDRDCAAIFDPFGNAVHTAQQFDLMGENVLVTGAGPIGIMAAAVKAVDTIDDCLGRLRTALEKCGGVMLLTADHGNIEMMQDPETHEPHTAHTTNVVPLIYIGRPGALAGTGALGDVAPTMLSMMGLPQPPQMTGKPLIRFE